MTRKKRWWLGTALLVAVLAVAAVSAMSRSGNGEGEETGPDVPTLAARIGDVQVVVREVGTVEPEIRVDIKSNLSGRVVDLPFRPGDRVAKGDLVARIEPDVNQAQDLLAVKSRLDEALIAHHDAEKEFVANDELYRQGLISQELHRQCETRLRQAEQAVAAAREKISVVEASGIPVGDNPQQVVNIRSPMAGVIIDRPVELGETVTGTGSFNAGTVIATVADLRSMIVEAGINEVDIGKIHEHQPVRVTLDAFPRKLFPGSIRRIAPAARLDNQVKVFDVEIALEHQGVELRTGMTANIEIRGETRDKVLTVPVESVFVRGDEEIVYVWRDSPLPAEEPPAVEGRAAAAAAGEAAGERLAEAEGAAETAPAPPETSGVELARTEPVLLEPEAEPTAESTGEAVAEVAGTEAPLPEEVLPEGWRDDPRQTWRRWFEERRVRTGIASTTDVEVVGGLAEGEAVALADPSRIEEERS